MRTARFIGMVTALALTVGGCRDSSPVGLTSPLLASRTSAPGRIAASESPRTQTTFVVGPLVISGIDLRFPGDRWQFRDALLSGPVTGGLSGNASVVLNGNFDSFAGSGQAWGSMTITTTSGDVWQASLTGDWKTGLPDAVAIQLLSHMVLRGPNAQTLKAECDETTATSETLLCTGALLSPHT